MTPSSQSLALTKSSKCGVVYVARNVQTGKLYIGQTSSASLAGRKRTHLRDTLRGSTCAFHNAIRKYGFDSFEFVVVQTCHSRNLLDLAEIWWIRCLGTMTPRGYNVKPGGHLPIFTDEMKQKISKALTGRKVSPETLKRMSASQKGSHWTEETRRKAMGRRRPPEVVAKIAASQRGIKKPSLNGNRYRHEYCEKQKAMETNRK